LLKPLELLKPLKPLKALKPIKPNRGHSYLPLMSLKLFEPSMAKAHLDCKILKKPPPACKTPEAVLKTLITLKPSQTLKRTAGQLLPMYIVDQASVGLQNKVSC